MAQFHIPGGADRSQPPGPRPDAQRGAEWPARDLDLVRGTSTNLLVVGDDDVVAGVIKSLWRSLAAPICMRHRDKRLRLSPTSPPFATMIIYDVDTLTDPEQRALYHWMGANGRTQVVSTAAKCLLPMLGAGTFNGALYYRLNVVLLGPTRPVAG